LRRIKFDLIFVYTTTKRGDNSVNAVKNKMKATISQAEKNERNLTVRPSGYGHWKIECDYRGKRIRTTTSDSISVDNFNSEFGEKDKHGTNRRKIGYIELCQEIIDSNE